MITMSVLTKNRAIAKARRIVEREAFDGNKRKWITAHADSYKDKSYRVELHILEGSPTRGYIVVGSGESCFGTVTAFDIAENVIGRIEWGIQ
jgi:hypothetical protein